MCRWSCDVRGWLLRYADYALTHVISGIRRANVCKVLHVNSHLTREFRINSRFPSYLLTTLTLDIVLQILNSDLDYQRTEPENGHVEKIRPLKTIVLIRGAEPRIFNFT